MHDGKELVLQPVGVGEPGDLNLSARRSCSSLFRASIGFRRRCFDRLKYLRSPLESLFCSFFRTCSIAQNA